MRRPLLWSDVTSSCGLRFRLLFLLFCLLAGLRSVALSVAIADHVETHEVGCAGFGSRSGDDAYDLALMDVTLRFENVFGHFNEFVGVAETLAEDGMGSPEEHAAVDDLLEG